MRKFICALSTCLLSLTVLSGCGNEPAPAPIIGDDEGGIVYRETETVTTLPKVRTGQKSSSDVSDSDETTTTAVKENQSDSTEENKTSGNGSENTSAGNSNSDNKSNSSAENNSGNNSDNSQNNSSGSDSDKAVQTNAGNSGSSAVTDTRPPATQNAPEELYYLEGIVYEVGDKSILLDESDLNLVNVGFDDKIKDVRVGDRVLVTYDGCISESYPSQATGYSIEVTEKADTGYTLQKFVCDNLEYNLKFSLLVPDGWTSKIIEYPTEGDFTDWGVRFTPESGTGGIDVSWHSAFAIREPFDTRPVTVNNFEAYKYTREGYLRFYVYDNNYIASNNFYGTEQYDEYIDTVEFIISTIDFECM
ncbi:MAG: YobA family protein [Ruminococcus sp.]|nr:YobA family protein [Ruminococcus sp.]MDE7225289.1 YobA family protein [Ruminococcus sp.]